MPQRRITGSGIVCWPTRHYGRHRYTGCTGFRLAQWLVGICYSSIVVILGVYELHNMMVHEGYHPLIWMSFALSILFLLAAMFPQQRLILLEVGLSAALLITLPLLFIRKKLDGAMVDWSLTLAIPVYLGWPLSVFLLLRGFQGGITPGFWWVLTVFLGVWGFDSGAFFAGHFFGKHKLAPAISPAKTWEGVAGGMVFSIAAALLFTTWPLGVPWYLAILLRYLDWHSCNTRRSGRISYQAPDSCQG